MRWAAGIVVALLLGSLTAAVPVARTHTPACRPGLHTGLLDARSYLVYVPDSARVPAPAVVSFHGRLQEAITQIDGTGLRQVADREGFIVVAPQARSGRWDFTGADTRFTGQILDSLQCEDPTRTYASGMSMGSAMAFLQVCAVPRRFAAFAGVGFEIYMPNCPDPQPAAILAFHGTADPIVPFSGGLTASTATAPPAEATMRQWARRDGCREYVREVVDPGVTRRSWDDCRGGTQVQFYRIRGGKHVWPKGRLSASTIMWEFFEGYRLPPAAGGSGAP
jgi:polyhydroxybutyrate depolymerase